MPGFGSPPPAFARFGRRLRRRQRSAKQLETFRLLGPPVRASLVLVGPSARSRRTCSDHQDLLRPVEEQAPVVGRSRADLGDLLERTCSSRPAAAAAGRVPLVRGLLPAHVPECRTVLQVRRVRRVSGEAVARTRLGDGEARRSLYRTRGVRFRRMVRRAACFGRASASVRGAEISSKSDRASLQERVGPGGAVGSLPDTGRVRR